MIFNQQKRHPIIAEAPQPEPPPPPPPPLQTQPGCSLECELASQQGARRDGPQQQQQQQQQHPQDSSPLQTRGLKRPSEAASPERPAVQPLGPSELAGQQASQQLAQVDELADQSDDDNEEFGFDYEPVLIRILNEKKLALSYSPDVVKFLKRSSSSSSSSSSKSQ